MTREVWWSISGGKITDFTGSTRYWQAANSISVFTGAAAPQNIGNSYASRVRAYVTAPVTGDYTFWIASDDDSELYLSQGESKFGRVKIAFNSGWVNPLAWDVKASQKSAAVSLVAGQRYFIEALHKDGSGGDHIAIAWQAPGGVRELIPASALESFTVDPNDIDNDELRDDWEAAHGFSLADNGTTNPDQHPLADPDQDGYSNLVESSFGTNPAVSSGEPGKMTRETWWNIPGGRISDFTGSSRYWQAADSVSKFAGAAAPQNIGDSHASRIRAHIIAPATGDYIFWIASDDDSELYLSSGASKFDRVKIAFNSGWVNPQAWDAKASQKSAPIPLVAGQRYFIEALHKDDRSADHLAIAWQPPGGSRELISGTAIESFRADPNDIDNDELRDDWEAAHGFSLADNGTANPDQHPLADPDHDGYSNHEESAYGTNPSVRGGVPGSLLLETWNNLDGNAIEQLTWTARFTGPPDISEFVFSAETPIDRGDNFGARMRGHVIAPVTGNYTFHLAGDDHCQLWLSESGGQFAKRKIAWIEGYTAVRQWNKFPSQKSQVIPLIAGQKVYIEAIQKEATNGDHMEIGWTVPGTSSIAVLPGSALESYAFDANDADGDNMPDDWELLHGLDPTIGDASADPDKDGIAHHLEYAFNTDPQVGNIVSGALLHELWLGIPGYRVKDMTVSDKFLAPPDFRSLVSSAQTVSQPYDSFGSRTRGYLTAPTTGTYTFWVQGDDETELWLSTSSDKFEKQLLVRPALNTYSFDVDLSQKSRPVSLVAGQQYYIEILHKDYYTSDFCQVGWTKPGAAREIIPGSVLQSFIPVANDQDDDGLPDDWETANGLSPSDNGYLNPNNGYRGDLDDDGLTNSEEWKAGTRADLADTDGDGVNDRDEVELMDTSALMANAAPFEPVATVPGASYSAVSGEWSREGDLAMQACVRGWLEYQVTLPAAGVHLLDLAFTPTADAGVSPDYEIVFSADGKTIGRATTSVAASASGHARILSPWLSAGSHTLRAFVDNSHHYRRVTVDQLQVLAARGPDANANGTPDWVDIQLAKNNSLEAPSECITSPVCLEGRARWFEMTTVNGSSVQSAPDDCWYASITLDPNQPTPVSASLENGAIAVTRQVSWIPVNLLDTGDLTIRQGDSLKLTAFRSRGTTSNEHSILTIEGQNHTVAADQPLIRQFDVPGSFPILVSHGENGNAPETTVTIHVVAAPALESPVCLVGYDREVDIPALQEGVFFQMDHRIDIGDTTTYPAGSRKHILRLNTLDDRPSVFRLGGTTGPVLASLPFRAMRVRDASETAMYFNGELGNKTYDVVMPVIVDGLHPDVVLKYDIYLGGVTFDDGSLRKSLLIPDDFTADGGHLLHFYKSGTNGSSCHRLGVWQGEKRIAYRQ